MPVRRLCATLTGRNGRCYAALVAPGATRNIKPTCKTDLDCISPMHSMLFSLRFSKFFALLPCLLNASWWLWSWRKRWQGAALHSDIVQGCVIYVHSEKCISCSALSELVYLKSNGIITYHLILATVQPVFSSRRFRIHSDSLVSRSSLPRSIRPRLCYQSVRV